MSASLSGRSIRIAVVGVGKIARDQHLPAIAANPDFELVATASRSAAVDGIPAFSDIAAMAASGIAVDAVSLCTPPRGRHLIARQALDAGWHVMLEKPPGATLSEVEALVARAPAGRTLFATWHSREAAGVAPARAWLAGRQVRTVRIHWQEDIRIWHPGQDWILAPGGFGVFDPGINALSIVTALLGAPVLLEDAVLEVPADRGAPIAATLDMRAGGAPVSAVLDFRQAGPQRWDIEIDTDGGAIALREGGRVLELPGEAPVAGADEEYPRLYRRFAELLREGRSDVDLAPLRLVADAFMIGRHRPGPPFALDTA